MPEPAMPVAPAPLFFPEALENRGSWRDWATTYGLSLKDFAWLSHVNLSTLALRSAQTPAMTVERLLIQRSGQPDLPLSGSLVLHPTPEDQGALLYTPYGGLEKFDSLALLKTTLSGRLADPASRAELVSLLSLDQRQSLEDTAPLSLGSAVISGDVFDDQKAQIRDNQRANAQRLLTSLLQLPSLTELLNRMLNDALRTAMPGLDQRVTHVSFYSGSPSVEGTPAPRRWVDSMLLADAVLLYYRQQGWPRGRVREFTHPQRPPSAGNQDQQHWDNAVKTTAESLTRQLASHLETFWNTDAVTGVSRRQLFTQAISDKARADLLFKRQERIITPTQSAALMSLFDRDKSVGTPPLTVESVRLWEYPPDYVELAGSLMLEQQKAYLYTPASGLQVLDNYQDLLDTVKVKFSAVGHEDELYDLLTREERQRFIGFSQPGISGAAISGPVFATLFDTILSKQQRNLDYALSVFRHSDGLVDVHALFDQSLDIRGMLDPQLTVLEAGGRWSTSPVIVGQQGPGRVLADKAALALKTCSSIDSPLQQEWAQQPIATAALQRAFIERIKPRLAHAWAVAIRSEAELRVLSGTLQANARAIVECVLNPDRPNRARRPGLNGFRPDAWWLTLVCSGQLHRVPLAHCLLMTERGGLDPRHSGQAILWTPARGLEVFDSIQSARTELDQRLNNDVARMSLLENAPIGSRPFHRTYRLGPLRLIEGHVLETRLQSALEHYLSACDQVRLLNLSADRQTRALDRLKTLPVPTGMARTAAVAQSIITQQSLPSWLAMSSLAEQALHLELLEQYRQSVTDDQDYLHGLKPLTDYVREQLENLQKSRFSGQFLDADQVLITPHLTLAGPVQSLTDFALNHVSALQGSGFTVSAQAGKTLPAGLDAGAVRQMTLQLNIKSAYTALLKARLTGSDPQVNISRQRFMRQVPWQLLHHGHALMLQERISKGAFDVLKQVLDMPDGIARGLINGATAVVRPVELLATSGATAVKALGMYLMGPGAGQAGPHLLYCPYAVDHGLLEFSDEAAVIAAFNTPGALQDLLIRRLPASQQATFTNLFKSTVRQTSEVTLGNTPIAGNLLQRFYLDNHDLLMLMLDGQRDTRGQSDWAALKELLVSGIKRAVSFLPGKLGYGVFLWHSYQDFKASAEALQNHQWGSALEAFISGAAQMVNLGRMMHASERESGTPSAQPTPALPWHAEAPIVAPVWSALHITDPRRTRLQAFENRDLALADLGRRTTHGTHQAPVSQQHYAAIAGKVYPVRRDGPLWRLVGEAYPGPYVRIVTDQQPVLDLDQHSVHTGKAMSLMHNRHATRGYVKLFLNVEARGMDEIRRKYPEKARVIIHALDLARFYAFNAMHNMALARINATTARLERFFKEMFDVSTVDASLMDKIKAVVVPICTALVDPMLDDLDSKRFVVGSNASPHSKLIAFVVGEDQEKAVHFTELFFDPQLDWYKSCLTVPFDVTAHAQAATIIHEFSHLFSATVDIAFLEARRPFSDLIAPITGFGAAMKQSQVDFQRNALSLNTPREELFARWNSLLNIWQDFGDVPGTTSVAKAVKAATGAKTIDDARQAFLDVDSAQRRIDTILRNADSVAYLICEMGRQLDPVSGNTDISP